MTDIDLTRHIYELYSAFNRRDSSFVISQMSASVTWPMAFKGGYALGPEAVRAYWEQQWQEIDPHVDPIAFKQREDGRIDVEVHQVVRELAGLVISDSVVHHVYRFEGRAIASMDIVVDE